jgi:hypothetical protein
MPITAQTEKQRRLWILDAIDSGITVKKVDDTVYNLNGKSVNIQARKLNGSRSWFNLGDREYLPTMDYFVYICGNHKTFYSIPRVEMYKLAKVTTENATDKRPQFHINVRTHEYLTGKDVLPIAKHYQKWTFY